MFKVDALPKVVLLPVDEVCQNQLIPVGGAELRMIVVEPQLGMIV
jgi:hypothetical protein